METPRDELSWTALRYALGELSAGDAEAFERQLADDQRAREALAREVEWSACVRVAEWEEADRRRRMPPRRPMRWAFAGVAASLVLALGVAIAIRSPGPEKPMDAGARESLAVVWAEGRQLREPAETDASDDDADFEFVTSLLEPNGDSVVTISDWVVEASALSLDEETP